MLLAPLLTLAPALWHGHALGPYDLLARWGLTGHPGGSVHNAVQSDQVLLFSPMTGLAWHQVHAGHVPLWNPYNVLGLPLAFDWESAVFSLPMLLAYAGPAGFAYSMVIIVKLLVAGSGVYVLCRVLGLRPASSAMGATVFELSGNVFGYSGWPIVGVLCWFGWIFAFAVLVVRGRHPVRDTALLAVAVAFAVYGGYPGSLVLLAVCLAIFFACYLLWAGPSATDDERGSPRAALGRLVGGGICGLGLAAPLLLPGVETGLGSARRYAPAGNQSYGLSHLPNFLASGLQGLDFRQSLYIGVVACVLVVLAVRFSWSSPAVRGFTLVAAATMALTFVGPVDRAVQAIPGAGVVVWDQAAGPMTFALAVLSAFGLETLRDSPRASGTRRWSLAGFVVAGAIILGLFVSAEANLVSGLRPYVRSLVWPSVEVAVGVACAGASLLVASRRQGLAERIWRGGPALFLGVNGLFLVVVGTGFYASSATAFAPTPAVTALARAVGHDLVGVGSCSGTGTASRTDHQVGLHPDVNVAYGIDELGVYDPILPFAYYGSWTAASGVRLSGAFQRVGLFCARITTGAQARLYGVKYVLEPVRFAGPFGAVRKGSFADEDLYVVPSAGRATVSVASPALFEGHGVPSRPVPVRQDGPASWRVTVSSSTASTLWLRLTAVPGWQATLDGRPVPLQTWDHGLMLDLPVPAGSHVVTVRYWPAAFTVGIAVALVTVLLLLACAVGAMIRRSRPRLSPPAPRA